jgi:hypothetical protein
MPTSWLARLLLFSSPDCLGRRESVEIVNRMVELSGGLGKLATLLAQLRQTPPERLDGVVAKLKQQHSVSEVRAAFIELLGVAAIEDFPVLRTVFLKHFAH